MVNIKQAIYIEKGIIALIEDDGDIGYYAQKGVTSISDEDTHKLILEGKLDNEIFSYDEIPEEYEIYFEDEEIMGKANKVWDNQ